jgi:DNA-binding beta-propeller fold protein YncE
MCPDGRDVLFARAGFNEAGALAVTPGRGPVWVADEQAGVLDILDASQLLGPRVRGLGAPASIALDPIDGTGWVTDRVGSVRHFRADGSNALPTTLNALLDPVGIATDPTTGAVWVTEFGGNRLRRYLRDGLPDGARPLAAPSRVAVDSTTGEAWVSSLTSGWLWRVSPALTVLDSLPFQSAIGIALDWRRRQAWLCDVNADQLVAIDMNTHAVKFRVSGLGAPWDAAVDLATGDVWVVTRGSGRAFRLSVTGQQISSVGGFGDPFAIRLDPGF